jgi:hypothetical protein
VEYLVNLRRIKEKQIKASENVTSVSDLMLQAWGKSLFEKEENGNKINKLSQSRQKNCSLYTCSRS